MEKGGLAGRGSTLILPLRPAQALFDKADRVNLVVVSNRGDEVAGERLSEEVTRELRVLFGDREVASQLKELLNQAPVLDALERRESGLVGDLKNDLSSLRTELPRDELSDILISLLADEDVSDEVLDVLNIDSDLSPEGPSSARLEILIEAGLEASILFRDLKEFRVFDFKHGIDRERDAGLFSIMVGATTRHGLRPGVCRQPESTDGRREESWRYPHLG